MKTTAVILSGGSGKRFGSDLPKQYVEVKGRSILSYTLDAFARSSVDEIVVVAAEEYIECCRQIAASIPKSTEVIQGGEQRYDSVLQGLRYAAVHTDHPEEDIVLIHDGARPLIRPEVIDDIIRTVKTCGAAIAAAPCTDTIKLADEEGNIAGTTDRSRTWAAQTPQTFVLQEILHAYEKIIGGRSQKETLQHITDDAMVYQMAFPGRPVRLINAGADNFKITAPSDLIRMEGMLGEIKQF